MLALAPETSNPAVASGEDHSISSQDYMDPIILGKGEKYPYTVPSFLVVTAMLREVKFSFRLSEDGDYVSFDGYMRECSLLDHPLPAVVRIIHGYSNTFIIKVTKLLTTKGLYTGEF